MLINACRVTRSEHQTTWILLAFDDITERTAARRAPEQISTDMEERVKARTAELVTAVDELEAFSYSVSHDLRAPLRAIDGYARILVEDFAAALPDPAPRFLTQIRTSAQTIGPLIDDLLRFSRLGRKVLATRVIDPTPTIQQVWAELAPERADRQVTLTIDQLPACAADPALLKQVYVNLLSNAIKFTRGRDAAQITVSGECAGGEVRYTVADNGVSFDMHYADKLFGVFQRLHRAEAFEGTGVGLAIVQRIVHRHGGRVWADATPDQGARISFALPEEGDHAAA